MPPIGSKSTTKSKPPAGRTRGRASLSPAWYNGEKPWAELDKQTKARLSNAQSRQGKLRGKRKDSEAPLSTFLAGHMLASTSHEGAVAL